MGRAPQTTGSTFQCRLRPGRSIGREPLPNASAVPVPAAAQVRTRTAHRQAYPPYPHQRSEEHTSELQSLMRISYAVYCWKKKKNKQTTMRTQTKTNPHKTTHTQRQ